MIDCLYHGKQYCTLVKIGDKFYTKCCECIQLHNSIIRVIQLCEVQ